MLCYFSTCVNYTDSTKTVFDRVSGFVYKKQEGIFTRLAREAGAFSPSAVVTHAAPDFSSYIAVDNSAVLSVSDDSAKPFTFTGPIRTGLTRNGLSVLTDDGRLYEFTVSSHEFIEFKDLKMKKKLLKNFKRLEMNQMQIKFENDCFGGVKLKLEHCVEKYNEEAFDIIINVVEKNVTINCTCPTKPCPVRNDTKELKELKEKITSLENQNNVCQQDKITLTDEKKALQKKLDEKCPDIKDSPEPIQSPPQVEKTKSKLVVRVLRTMVIIIVVCTITSGIMSSKQ